MKNFTTFAIQSSVICLALHFLVGSVSLVRPVFSPEECHFSESGESRHFSPGMRHLSLMSVFLDLPPLGVCLENATRSGRAVYSVVQINVVKGCVRVVLVHASFNHVYFDSAEYYL